VLLLVEVEIIVTVIVDEMPVPVELMVVGKLLAVDVDVDTIEEDFETVVDGLVIDVKELVVDG
jgi:hypothetical protein